MSRVRGRAVATIVVLLTAVGAMTVAHAARLTVGSKTVAAGDAVVGRCASGTTLTVSYQYDANSNVSTATVSGIPIACQNSQLSFTLTNNGALVANAPTKTASVTTGTVSFGFSPAVTSGTANAAAIAIVGP